MSGGGCDRPLTEPVGEDNQVRRGGERADEAVDTDQAVGAYEQRGTKCNRPAAGQRAPEHGADGQSVEGYWNQQRAEVVAGEYAKQADPGNGAERQRGRGRAQGYAAIGAQVGQVGAEEGDQAEHEQVGGYGQQDVAQYREGQADRDPLSIG